MCGQKIKEISNNMIHQNVDKNWKNQQAFYLIQDISACMFFCVKPHIHTEKGQPCGSFLSHLLICSSIYTEHDGGNSNTDIYIILNVQLTSSI